MIASLKVHQVRVKVSVCHQSGPKKPSKWPQKAIKKALKRENTVFPAVSVRESEPDMGDLQRGTRQTTMCG
jgi:hypothetical protein